MTTRLVWESSMRGKSLGAGTPFAAAEVLLIGMLKSIAVTINSPVNAGYR